MRRAVGSRWRWLLVPLLAVPLGWLLFTGLGRDPRLIPSPLVGQPCRRSPGRRWVVAASIPQRSREGRRW